MPLTHETGQTPPVTRVVTKRVKLVLTGTEAAKAEIPGGALRAASTLSGVPLPRLYERFAAPHPNLGATPNPDANYDTLRTRFATEVARLTG